MASLYRYDSRAVVRWGTITQGLLIVFLIVTSFLGLSALFIAVQEMQSGISMHLFTVPSYAGLVLAAFIPAAIALTFWVWRAHANLHANRLEELRFSPPWAALSLWVPFANLYVPKGAMRQLWNRSHGEPAWFANQSVDKVTSWWTAFVVGALLATVLTLFTLFDRFTNIAIVSPPGTHTAGFGFASLLLAASGWFLLQLVGAITQAQKSAVAIGETFT